MALGSVGAKYPSLDAARRARDAVDDVLSQVDGIDLTAGMYGNNYVVVVGEEPDPDTLTRLEALLEAEGELIDVPDETVHELLSIHHRTHGPGCPHDTDPRQAGPRQDE